MGCLTQQAIILQPAKSSSQVSITQHSLQSSHPAPMGHPQQQLQHPRHPYGQEQLSWRNISVEVSQCPGLDGEGRS